MYRGVRPDVSRAAVLGGTGWVGRYVCAALKQQGYDVLVIARNHAPHVSAYKFQPLDLVTAVPGSIAEILYSERVQVVINATGGANTTDGWDRTEAEMTNANVHAVQSLLTAMTSLPWRPRLVHIGTIHEYGPVSAGTLIHESTVPRPVNVYAHTKLAGSTAVLDAACAGAVDGVVLRLANVCGPHPSPASFPGKLLSLLRQAAEGTEAVLSIADAKRDFVDVRDVADASVKAAQLPVTGHVINIGSGVVVEIRELVAQLVIVAGLPATAIREEDSPVPSLGGNWIQSDIRLAGRLLGWHPRIKLRESLQAMWEVC